LTTVLWRLAYVTCSPLIKFYVIIFPFYLRGVLTLKKTPN